MDIKPEFQRVYDALFERLANREWPPGGRIPSIKELQTDYEINSLNTVRRAQQMLVEEGYLATQQGRGAYVVAYPEVPAGSERVKVALAAIEKASQALAQARRLLEDAA